jgi:hypothetical protein
MYELKSPQEQTHDSNVDHLQTQEFNFTPRAFKRWHYLLLHLQVANLKTCQPSACPAQGTLSSASASHMV